MVILTVNNCWHDRDVWGKICVSLFLYVKENGVLGRSQLRFNNEAVKVFEHLQIDCWNPDYHFLIDKINDKDYGWVYKSESVEEDFILFLNILYSTQDRFLKSVINNNMVVEYNGN